MLDLIVSWLCTAIAFAFEEFVDLVMPLFSFNFTLFNATFPFAAKAYTLFQRVALPVTLLIAALGLLPFFTGRMDKASTTPVRTLISAAVAVAAIYYGNYILNAILDFCQYPFDALLGMDGSVSESKWWETLFSASGVVTSVFNNTSTLLYLVILCMLCFNLIKMLLEVIERYVITFVLLYLSPLFASSLASESTAGIYKKFITMFISQCLLLFLNLWCMKMALSGLANIATNGVTPIIGLLMTYAFIRISQRMDTYLNQLGLNSVTTGEGLLGDMMASGAMLMSIGKSALGGGGGDVGSGAGGNAVLGANRTANQYISRYNPVSAATRAVTDFAKGGANSVAGASEKYRTAAAKVQENGGEGSKYNVSGLKEAAGHIAKGAAEGFRNSDNIFSRTATGRNRAGATIHDSVNGMRTAFGKGPVPSNQAALMDKIVNGQCETDDLSAIGGNYHLARDGMHHIAQQNAIIEEPQEVAAFIRGLSHESEAYKDMAGFVEAGYQSKQGQENISYSMNASGINADYEADGYHNSLSLKSHNEFQKLSATEREGYKQYRVADGHRYHYKVETHRLDVPNTTKDTKAEKKDEKGDAKNTPSENAAPAASEASPETK